MSFLSEYDERSGIAFQLTPEEIAALQALAGGNETGPPKQRTAYNPATNRVEYQEWNGTEWVFTGVEATRPPAGTSVSVALPPSSTGALSRQDIEQAVKQDGGTLTSRGGVLIATFPDGSSVRFDPQTVRGELRYNPTYVAPSEKKAAGETILGAATYANLYGHQAAQTQAVKPQAVSTQGQQGPGGTSKILSQQELQNAIENEGIQVGESLGKIPGTYTGLKDLNINYGGVYPGGGLQYMEGTGLSEGNTPQFKGFLPATEPGQNARSVGYSFRPNDILAAIGLRPGGVGVRGYSPNDTDTALNAMAAMAWGPNGPGISWVDKKTGLKMQATLNELSQGLNPIGAPIKNRKQLLESLAESLGRAPTDFELEQMGAPQMAGGGGFTTGEPILMIGAKTGKTYAVAGEDADNNGVPNAERITVEPLTAPYGPKIGSSVQRFAQGTDDYGIAAGAMATGPAATPSVPTPAYGMSTQAYQQYVYDLVKKAAMGAGPLQRWLDDWVMRHDPTPTFIHSGQHSGQGETYRKDMPEPEADLESVGTHPFMQQAIGGTNLAGASDLFAQGFGKAADTLGSARDFAGRVNASFQAPVSTRNAVMEAWDRLLGLPAGWMDTPQWHGIAAPVPRPAPGPPPAPIGRDAYRELFPNLYNETGPGIYQAEGGMDVAGAPPIAGLLGPGMPAPSFGLPMAPAPMLGMSAHFETDPMLIRAVANTISRAVKLRPSYLT